MGTPNRFPNSTDRGISTRAPAAAILQHLVEGDLVELAGVGHHPGIGGEHAIDIGVDLAHVGVQVPPPSPPRWHPIRPDPAW